MEVKKTQPAYTKQTQHAAVFIFQYQLELVSLFFYYDTISKLAGT